jgi:hypothetical protein
MPLVRPPADLLALQRLTARPALPRAEGEPAATDSAQVHEVAKCGTGYDRGGSAGTANVKNTASEQAPGSARSRQPSSSAPGTAVPWELSAALPEVHPPADLLALQRRIAPPAPVQHTCAASAGAEEKPVQAKRTSDAVQRDTPEENAAGGAPALNRLCEIRAGATKLVLPSDKLVALPEGTGVQVKSKPVTDKNHITWVTVLVKSSAQKDLVGLQGSIQASSLTRCVDPPPEPEAKPDDKQTPTPVPPPATAKRPSGESPKSRYRNFIADAARYGMPVKFLEEVAKAYTIKEVAADEDNVTKPWTSTIGFRPGVLTDDSLNAANAGMSSEASTVYHESTHAYLRGLMLKQEPFKTMITDGIKHYTGALTTDGKANSDPERVFHEAAAEYVDNRMGTWWSAFTTLTTYAATAKLTTPRIDQQRKEYDANIARRTFGYSEEGFLTKKQTNTTEPMTLAMKTFLDHELLEDKIPERFDDVVAFQDIIKRARSTNRSNIA